MNRIDLGSGSETGWDLNKKYLNEIIPVQSRGNMSQGIVVQDDNTLQPTKSLTTPGDAASGHLEINVVMEGYRMGFSKLDGPGQIKIRFMGQKFFSFIDFLFFIIPLGFLFFSEQYTGIKRTRALLVGFGIVLLLMAFAHPFYLNLLDSTLYALILAGMIIYSSRIREAFSRFRGKPTPAEPPSTPGSPGPDSGNPSFDLGSAE